TGASNVVLSQSVGDASTQTITVNANQSITGTGLLQTGAGADSVALTATTGDIGVSGTPINTRTGTLTLTANDATNGSAFISEFDALTLSTNTVRNTLQVTAGASAAGNLTVNDATGTTGLNITLATTTGASNVVLSQSVGNASTQTITVNANQSITGTGLLQTGAGADSIALTATTGDIGVSGTPVNTRTGTLTLTANDATNGSAFIS